ncbi:LysM peptidoglycan-binding domain-containing protein [bacterium]|nr:LysM peptidoglycan-binding domain-containing protein [bacterium]MBU4361085.1 LysM peptidoglycan-binding domain-containing protein [bacterium]
MYVAQKHNRDKKNSIIFLTLLLLLIFSISFYSFADNNDEFITYKATKGDTLWSISKEYNISLNLILALNNIKDKDSLSIDQIIKIPQDNLPAADYNMHIVKKGETLWSIAQEYNLSVDLILATNNIANSELISIGQQIEILSTKSTTPETNIITQPVIDKKNNNMNNNISEPENIEPIVYTVKAGDSLWNISRKYGASVEIIVDVNNLRDKDSLSIGQKLEIPAIGGGVSNSSQKQEPIIVNYTVVKGDSLWSISQRYDVNMNTIISTNNLKEISRLSIGQKLKLPITNMDIAKAEGYGQEAAAEEIIYSVKKGESLWSISREYNVKLEAIIAANSIIDASKISAGQQLRIPNVPGTGTSSNIYNFIWPVRKRINSPYGMRVSSGRKEFHSGIDIGAPTGTNIVAAESGRVSYSGYMRGYGNVIILSHNEGYSTVYAHNSVNSVKKGQYVTKGNIIGKVGRTGNATGSHLHFEVRLNGKPVNPLSYLK